MSDKKDLDFPSICEKCLGESQFLKMIKKTNGDGNFIFKQKNVL
jgi:hypothetical protein